MKVRRFKVNFPWTTAGWFWLGLAIFYTLYEVVRELGGDSDFVVCVAFLFIVWNVASWLVSHEGEGTISDGNI